MCVSVCVSVCVCVCDVGDSLVSMLFVSCAAVAHACLVGDDVVSLALLMRGGARCGGPGPASELAGSTATPSPLMPSGELGRGVPRCARWPVRGFGSRQLFDARRVTPVADDAARARRAAPAAAQARGVDDSRRRCVARRATQVVVLWVRAFMRGLRPCWRDFVPLCLYLPSLMLARAVCRAGSGAAGDRDRGATHAERADGRCDGDDRRDRAPRGAYAAGARRHVSGRPDGANGARVWARRVFCCRVVALAVTMRGGALARARVWTVWLARVCSVAGW